VRARARGPPRGTRRGRGSTRAPPRCRRTGARPRGTAPPPRTCAEGGRVPSCLAVVWDLFTGGRLLVCGAGGTAVEWMEEVRTEVAWMEAVRTGGGVGGEGTASYRSVESRWQHARRIATASPHHRSSSSTSSSSAARRSTAAARSSRAAAAAPFASPDHRTKRREQPRSQQPRRRNPPRPTMGAAPPSRRRRPRPRGSEARLTGRLRDGSREAGGTCRHSSLRRPPLQRTQAHSKPYRSRSCAARLNGCGCGRGGRGESGERRGSLCSSVCAAVCVCAAVSGQCPGSVWEGSLSRASPSAGRARRTSGTAPRRRRHRGRFAPRAATPRSRAPRSARSCG